MPDKERHTASAKYPRTPHLPWSKGLSKDDRKIVSLDSLIGVELVISEKADGSNVCLERESVFARSHAGAPRHPSFDALKARHASLRTDIPEGRQIFAEWLWARHSIAYDKLPDYLLVFGIRDTVNENWLSWDTTEAECGRLGVPTVPVLWRGTVDSEEALLRQTERFISERRLGSEQEGIVVRIAASFSDNNFPLSTAKLVRANHVQTDLHWSTRKIERNQLR